MPQMPSQPDEFAERVAAMLARLKPEVPIDEVAPSELVINGRRLDLDNLMRLVAADIDRGQEIVEQYLTHLFDEDSFAMGHMPWELARGKIMPRIQPVSIFAHLAEEMVAHVPYVNDTVIVFVIDLPNMTISITTEQMIRWGISSSDELEQVARRNLAAYTPELELRWLDSDDGGRAAIIASQDGYDASRLLLDDLHRHLKPKLGGDFFVGAPSRDMFVAMSPDPQRFVGRVRERIDRDFHRLPYPITNRLFYVTMDGVAGTEREAA